MNSGHSYSMRSGLSKLRPYGWRFALLAVLAGPVLAGDDLDQDLIQVAVFGTGGTPGLPVLTYTNGMIARYRAHDLVGLYAEGDTVTNWPDISGNGRDAVRVLAGHQVLRESGIGDRAAVEMTNGIFRTANFGVTNATPISVVLVFRSDATASGTVVLDSLTDQRFTFYVDLTSWRMRLNANGFVGTSDTDAHFMLMQYHQATSTVFSALWQDGSLVSAGVAAGGSTGLQGITIGARANNTTTFRGRIAEVVYYDHDVVDAGGKPAIEEYVTTFYGSFPL